MKKNYDLEIIKLGLEKQIFFFWDVMNLFYGECRRELVNKKDQHGCVVHEYDWQLTNFYEIPVETRIKLLKILFSKEDFEERNADYMAEFYERIYCILWDLLAENVCPTDEEGKDDRYECTYDGFVSPWDVMQEVMLWHQMGLPVTQDEATLLLYAVREFLAEETVHDDEYIEDRVRRKKKMLVYRLKELKRKFKMMLARQDRLEALMKKLEKTSRISNRVSRLKRKINSVFGEMDSIERQLALAEAYRILHAKFPVWTEDK